MGITTDLVNRLRRAILPSNSSVERLDVHTWCSCRCSRRASRITTTTPPGLIPPPQGPARRDHATEGFPLKGYDYEILAEDDDAPSRPSWLKKFIEVLNGFAPLEQYPQTWMSPQICREELDEIFGDLLPIPKVEWSDPTSDEAFELFVRQGLGAHRLSRHPEPEHGGFILRMNGFAAPARARRDGGLRRRRHPGQGRQTGGGLPQPFAGAAWRRHLGSRQVFVSQLHARQSDRDRPSGGRALRRRERARARQSTAFVGRAPAARFLEALRLSQRRDQRQLTALAAATRGDDSSQHGLHLGGARVCLRLVL